MGFFDWLGPKETTSRAPSLDLKKKERKARVKKSLPSPSSVTTPLEIRKVGSRWEVWARGVHSKFSYGKYTTTITDPTPVVLHNGKAALSRRAVGLPPSPADLEIAALPPHRFAKKQDAKHIAGQIGMYLFKLGQFMHTWTTETEAK